MTKPYRRRNEHRIWGGSTLWFVNYYGDDIHGSFATWQEAMDYLTDELASARIS